ncbi:Hybrid signal transduction histidine kinase K [Planktothrix tepida]|uniref:histidine kinase n=2 Tax=Planktothrix TaxID=54304 RepID=A0A1J1LH73_9CYAN|nr:MULTISPECIES: hybrid sensor histidine kinase/response regulator [Planktothrix]CAD5925590.1 Hybrid signal transduction histidine kinase K [Planktothrix tepida]CAD5981467.1 Hybrid signal transduction histidine kinase K [Planktothrix pseudagardhii]CUR31236.1 Histidine Kinase [Planktothrix tepida PCC 9214]
MSPQADLQTFMQVVPVCRHDSPLEALRFIFSQGNSEQVVIINSEHYPLGLISLHRFLPYLLNTTFPTSPDPEQPFLNEVLSTILEPIIGVPSHLSLEDFWLYLQYQSSHPVLENSLPQTVSPALINHRGEFIGLINSLQVLRYLAQYSQRFTQIQQPRPSPTLDFNSEPHQQLDVLATGNFSVSQHLIQFLDELPIPLMIQSDDGTIVNQNLAWRSLIGRGSEVLQEVAESVTRWSEASETFSPTEKYPTSSLESSIDSGFPSRHLTNVSQPLTSNSPTLQMPSWCQLGSQPDTYICICPIAHNQERVWQFTRQHLNPEWEMTLCLGNKANDLWLVLAQDITEQHRVAQELTAKNTDLIQLNRLKDEFMACISHELKTPLTAVLGLSSLLKDQALGELNEKQARYAQLIHKSGRHLMLVVNDILDLTRMETGQLELVPEPLQIQAVCERAFEMTLQQYQSQDKSDIKLQAEILEQLKSRFTLEIKPGLETLVADELRLRQMLVNLLCNALKFTPDGSEFGLQVSRWENWIAFTVWDKGIGIPEDKQHLIFQKFQQLESPLTRKFEGTGLGLVLTQRLARLHGGDVSFISKPNKGSQFTLLLPPSPPRCNWELGNHSSSEEPEFLPSSRSSSPQQSRLVLVVETVPHFIQTLNEQLTHLGYRVVIARSGTEAVEKARRLQPRIILLNPLIPLLSGWDVLTLLKTDVQTHKIPVIVTATLGDKQRATANHCDGFLSLPVQGAELEKILVELLPEVSSSEPQQLMILWLSLSGDQHHLTPINTLDKPNSIYHSALFLSQFSQCRILEADDINQAALIARIWHPNIIVLERDGSVKNPLYLLTEISQQESLAHLPIVTLDPVTTQVANQVKNLSIFPCLASPSDDGMSLQSFSLAMGSALLEVIQIATRLSWKPSILVVDSSVLPQQQLSHPVDTKDHPSKAILNPKSSTSVRHSTVNSDCLDAPNNANIKIEQALVQYIEIAGFRSIMGKGWEEILQKIQCKSLDLMLICFRQQSFSNLVEALSILEKMEAKIPVLILAQSDVKVKGKSLDKKRKTKSSSSVEIPNYSWEEMMVHLQRFSSSFPLKVLPFNLSVESLLEEMKTLLTHLQP